MKSARRAGNVPVDMSAFAHKPATPLPWQARDYANEEGGIWIDCNAFVNKGRGHLAGGTLATVGPLGSKNPLADAAYLVHAANAYPDLVVALRNCLERWVPSAGTTRDECESLLRKLGEAS